MRSGTGSYPANAAAAAPAASRGTVGDGDGDGLGDAGGECVILARGFPSSFVVADDIASRAAMAAGGGKDAA